MKKTINLGMISFNDGRVIAIDPSYKPEANLCGIYSVKKGKWICKADIKDLTLWGERVMSLRINHVSAPRKKATEYVGINPVDSGKCGFFNLKYYRKQHNNPKSEEKKTWYDRIYQITFDNRKHNCGTIDEAGVVSSSGIGDGLYNCYAAYDDNGEIIALRLDFSHFMAD